MGKNFLIIEHDGYLDEFTIKAGKDKGLRIFIVTKNVEPWLLNYIDENDVIFTDTQNIEELAEFINEFSNEKQIFFSGVGTFFERYVLHTSRIAERLNLIGVRFDAAKRSSRDKYRMRLACKDFGLKQPEFELVKIDEKNKIMDFIFKNGKSVIKPINGAGSIAVSLINSTNEVDLSLQSIKKQILDKDNNYVARDNVEFIIEQYLEGKVISIDGLIQSGHIYFIGETEFYMGSEPRFVQEGGITPTSFNKGDVKEFREYVKKVILATGINNCGFHCELRIDKNGNANLIEIACRTPGGPILLNYDSAYGINGTDLIYDIWLGNKINPQKVRSNFLIHKDVFAKRQGVIKSILIPDDVRKKTGLIDVIEFAGVGDEIYVDSLSSTSLYYYSVMAETYDEVLYLSKLVEEKIKYEVE